jgi:hypothetical protein
MPHPRFRSKGWAECRTKIIFHPAVAFNEPLHELAWQHTRPPILPGRCAGQADKWPYLPPIRFARCYRCGRFNLSILNASGNWVKLFGCEDLKRLEPMPGFEESAFRPPKRRFFWQFVTALSCGCLSCRKNLLLQTRLAATEQSSAPLMRLTKVGRLGRDCGICRKVWFFRG